MSSPLRVLAVCAAMALAQFMLYASAAGQAQATPMEVKQVTIFPTQPGANDTLPRLFPDRDLMVKRNAALYYHRAIESWEQIEAMWRQAPQFQSPAVQTLVRNTATFFDNYEVWMTGPLDQLPLKDMNTWLSYHQGTVNDLKRAARSSECDWGLLPAVDEPIDPFGIILRDVQQLRSLARMLFVRARVAIAEHDYQEAIETLSLGYKMAHDIQESRILVGCIVGIACARIMNEGLILLQQQADAPNLFWGLSTMPRPLVDTKLAMRTEMNWIAGGAGFEMLDPKHMEGRSLEAWRSAFSTGNKRLEEITGSEQGPLDWLAVRGYPIAKQGLLNFGFETGAVDAMPVGEVVARYQSHLLQDIRDEMLKWVTLPYPEISRFRDQYEAAIKRASVNASNDPLGGVLGLTDLLAANASVVEAEIRLQRQLAALQVIEALRWHLAKTGQLPTALSEIEALPVPDDPSTGEPFRYELNRDVAKLYLPDPVRSRSLEYEITPVK